MSLTRIKNLPRAERPRERLLAASAAMLSDQELLMVILGSGSCAVSVERLARHIMETVDRKSLSVLPDDFLKIKGIGSAKAALLVAALEFARRRIRPEGVKVKSAHDVLPLLHHLTDRKQEHFTCTSLNGAHEVIATRVVTIGLVNACQIHPREVLCDPITDRATAIIVGHNHPSGDLTPSAADKEVTERLKAACGIVGITLLDHVIFSTRGYYSFQEHALL